MRILALCLGAGLSPIAAAADPLSLMDFAVFHGATEVVEQEAARAQIVTCLQGTRTPRSCIGTVVQVCDGSADACVAQEASVWEHYGYDIYLALRRSLGGPDWIDDAHIRIGSEMVARCAAIGLEEGDAALRACEMREAAGRALDLRFALVAP